MVTAKQYYPKLPKYLLIRIKNMYEGTLRIKNSFKFRNYGIYYNNFQVKFQIN